MPTIQLAPRLFEYDGYKGSFSSWQDFGIWNYNLYEETNTFNAQRTGEILSLVKNSTTDAEKIKALYNYLKRSTRYVSIQLGIGGFKPFPVNFVDDKKYGDCKALTNYMRYLLKVAGIASYPALINAGYNKLPADVNFPASVFNHVILCVPLKNDTVWLECTSKNNECGILGTFTEKKKALLLTEKGGILINTPASNYNNNILTSKTIVLLDEEGGAATNSSFFYKGEFNDFFEQMQQYSNDKRKWGFGEYLYFKNADEFQTAGFDVTASTLHVTAGYQQLFDFKAGSKYFFKPKILKFSEAVAQQNENRQSPYIFNYPYLKSDTTIYNLGRYFAVESLPAKKIIKNEYAVYEQDVQYNSADSTITTITTFILKHNIIPSKNYKELAAFFSEMNQMEHNKIVIKKL
ncbi:MAG: hypothetical protein IPJ81_16430 [Chitinophagaceae bacterium]|nr:hypothetical protein [Chitinophagaceae bacterium]